MSELEPLEESVPSSSSSTSPIALVGAVLGLIGLGVGITGIVMARSASREATALRTDMAGISNRVEGVMTETNLKLDDMDKSLERVGAAIVPLQRDRTNVQQVVEGVRQFQSAIAQNRDAINELSLKVTQLAEARPAARAPSPTTGGTAEVPADGTYIIQAGDTFGRIAGRFNTTIAAIEAANPGVDPRRLQIGQRINLPRTGN